LNEYLAAAALLIGAFFMLVASVGLIRLPDVYSRMHAATKATTFGMLGILSAVVLSFGEAAVATHAILAILFLFLTAPVAAPPTGKGPRWPKSPGWTSTGPICPGRDQHHSRKMIQLVIIEALARPNLIRIK
jgi:multicomponent Na+:H+ antiporter subunit G